MTVTRHEPAATASGPTTPFPPAPAGRTGRRADPDRAARPESTDSSGSAPRAGVYGRNHGTIRSRVARILALPAIVVLLLLGLLSAGQIQDYRDSAATSRSVTLALAVQDLVHELQTERGVTAGVLGGNSSFRPELRPARRQVDQQRARVEALVAGGGAAQDRVASAVRQLDGLAAVRAATDSSSSGMAPTFEYYTARITSLAGVEVGLDDTVDQELRRGVAALQALDDYTEATSQERAFLNGTFSLGGFQRGTFVRFAAMRADRDTALARFDRFATAEQRRAMDFVLDTGAARTTAAFEQVATDAADGRHIVVNPQSWWSGLTTLLDDARQLQQHVGSQIQVRAHDLQESSARRIGGLIAFVVLCFAGSIYLAALASISITRPLAALAAEADDLAAQRLPEAVARAQRADPEAPPRPPDPVPIPVRATQEIRSVATALDRLQTAAYDLATEQAVQRRDTIESLANLGRRNQNLIRRQLGFITSLEREEIDPASLANLFELDHLATRMRRNAASLLVLVDASSPRQWSQAVSVADVIRAAVSEVEEYRRVSLRRVDEAMVSGSAIGSIAHLLSELIENGLTFSPPDTEVEVQGRRMGEDYLIAITDQGVGMNPEDLRRANSRLRGEGDFIAAPTRFLGHFVVGKLAQGTGVDVQLLPSPVTGVTARVTLPAALLSASATVEVSSVEDVARDDLVEVTSAGDLESHRARHEARPEPPARLAPAGRLALAPLPQNPPPAAAPPEAVPAGPAAAADRPVAASRSGADAEDPDRTPPSGLPLSAHPAWGPATWPPSWDLPKGGGPTLPSAGQPISPRRAAGSTGSVPVVGASTSVNPGSGTTSSPTTGSIAVDEAARTRNGLRKRTPRTERAAEPVRRVIDLDAATGSPARPAPRVDDSPAQVGARLTALRAGLQRGHTTASKESE
jgi:anti-sigma regulatory factor (Ser/Thr protein kinase)